MNNYAAIFSLDPEFPIQKIFQASVNRANYRGIGITVSGTRVFDHLGSFGLSYQMPGQLDSAPLWQMQSYDHEDFYAIQIGEIYDSKGFIDRHRPQSPPRKPNSDHDYFEVLATVVTEKTQHPTLSELNGSFNILVYDKRDRAIYLVTDRHATIPMFVLEKGKQVFLATEATLLAGFVDHSAQIVNQEALIQKLTLGFILANDTLINNCKVLPAASVTKFSPEQKLTATYWNYEYNITPGAKDALIDRYIYFLKQAVERRSKNRRVVIALSGGKDSRTIAMAYEFLNGSDHSKVQSFTYGETGANDLLFGRMVAEHLGWSHHKLLLSNDFPLTYGPLGAFLTGGTFGCFAINGIEFYHKIRQLGERVLLGTAGDVLTGSFLSEDLFVQKAPSLEKFTQYLLALFNTVFMVDEVKDVLLNCPYAPRAFLTQLIRSRINSLPQYDHYANLYDHFNLAERHRKWLHIGTNFWKSITNVGMPFYDNDLFNFLITVPIELRKNQRIAIEAFKKYAPALASIPDCHTGMPLTAEAYKIHLWRFAKNRYCRYVLKKISWDPFRTHGKATAKYSWWIKTTLQTEIIKLLTSEQSLSQNYLNPIQIQKIIDDHLSGRRNRTSEIDTLIVFEFLLRMIL